MISQETIKTENSFLRIKDKYIKSKNYPCVIVLTGKEKLFKKSLISELKSNIFTDSGDIEMNFNIYYDKSDATYGEPIEVASTAPFGGEKRLIVVFNYQAFTEKNDFLEYIIKPSKSTVLILESEQKLKDDPLYKYVFKKKEIGKIDFIDFPEPNESDFETLIRSYISFAQKKISNDAVNYLLQNLNQDYTSLYSELDKIINYHSDKNFLDEEDIKDFTHMSRHATVFDFINALLSRNRKECFSIMPHLENDASTSVSLILNSFSILYYLKIFPPQTTLNEISKITGSNIYALEKTKPFVNMFTVREINDIVNRLYNLNILSVTTPQNVFKCRFNLFVFAITK